MDSNTNKKGDAPTYKLLFNLASVVTMAGLCSGVEAVFNIGAVNLIILIIGNRIYKKGNIKWYKRILLLSEIMIVLQFFVLIVLLVRSVSFS